MGIRDDIPSRGHAKCSVLLKVYKLRKQKSKVLILIHLNLFDFSINDDDNNNDNDNNNEQLPPSIYWTTFHVKLSWTKQLVASTFSYATISSDFSRRQFRQSIAAPLVNLMDTKFEGRRIESHQGMTKPLKATHSFWIDVSLNVYVHYFHNPITNIVKISNTYIN